MRKCPAVLFGLPIAALTLIAAPANAAPSDIATCEQLAAHPDDRDKPAGVSGRVKIPMQDVAPALKVCAAAAATPGAPRRVLMELGRAYEFNRQPSEAAKAYRKAADSGSTSAMVGLGALYAEGNGVKKNYGEARKLFQQTADAGDPTGMDNLASIYGAGLGVPVDLATARAWYEKAAALNLPEAMFQLGLMTQDGDTGPKDDVAAKELFEKAAALGNDDAAAALKRLQCLYLLKYKDGKTAGNVSFDGKT